MKPSLCRFAALAIACFPLGRTYCQTVAELSLDDCVAIALSENPTVRIADMDIAKADYSKRKRLGNCCPH